MLEEVKELIRASSPSTKIYVGCDSRQLRDYTLFVTVVVIHYDGNKGARVVPFSERVPKIQSRHWRLVQETHYSTGLALELRDVVGSRELLVHLDYNPSDKHKSNGVVKEAIGYVLGQGLQYKLKPDAWAATSAADWLGRHNMKFKNIESRLEA